MIICTIVRKYCSHSSLRTSVQYITSLKANLNRKMLDQNSHSYSLFKTFVDLPEIQFLNHTFTSGGFHLRIAGGAVRDILSGIEPNDLDFASTARPEQMIQMLRDKENIRLITTPAGERHGTVTVRINDKCQYEITTLRIDQLTDGRHARVQFTDDWKLDASRRDLTINSMFLDLDGVVYDYFNGEEDLKLKKIQFVGDAEARIKEDYLRIFRYFRFHARFGSPGQHDENTLIVLQNNCNGLKIISGERIWSELKRILMLKQCNDVVHIMFNRIGIGKHIGLQCDSDSVDSDTHSCDLSEFDRVLHNLCNGVEEGFFQTWESSTLLAAIIRNDNELLSVIIRMKLSNMEKESILYIISNRNDFKHVTLDTIYCQLALAPKPQQNQLRKCIVECLKYSARYSEINAISNWEIPTFPFKGHLIGQRVKKPNQISFVMNELKIIWAKSGFALTENDLILEMEKVLNDDRLKK